MAYFEKENFKGVCDDNCIILKRHFPWIKLVKPNVKFEIYCMESDSFFI
jgi:hypothetical protein